MLSNHFGRNGKSAGQIGIFSNLKRLILNKSFTILELVVLLQFRSGSLQKQVLMVLLSLEEVILGQLHFAPCTNLPAPLHHINTLLACLENE